MKDIIPEFFKGFKCIASACPDNCCIGWEIDIDEDTMEKYSALKTPLGDKLSVSIERCQPPHFILGKNDRCPFLNKDNLCDIIIELGEENIPFICQNHPRFYTYFEDRREVGMGLCCQAAAELVFSCKEPLDMAIPYPDTDSIDNILCYARDRGFYILQRRESDIFTRLSVFIDYCRDLDDHLFFDDREMIKKTADDYADFAPAEGEKSWDILEICTFFKDLDPIDEAWQELSREIAENHEKIAEYLPQFVAENQENLYKYEHIAVYLTYRHFLSCREDYTLGAIGVFVAIGVVYCLICDAYKSLFCGDFSTEDTARLYSKEVEYSQENTDRVMDFEVENLIEILHFLR